MSGKIGMTHHRRDLKEQAVRMRLEQRTIYRAITQAVGINAYN